MPLTSKYSATEKGIFAEILQICKIFSLHHNRKTFYFYTLLRFYASAKLCVFYTFAV